MHVYICVFILKESLRDSCSQVSALQQRERERELDREREKDRERLSTSSPQTSSELEQKIQELQDKGQIRLGRSASGGLDIQVVPVTVVEYVQVQVPAPTPAPTPEESASSDSGYCQKETCFEAASAASAPFTFISSMMYDPFTFALLNDTEGELDVCDGDFCCRLRYRRLSQGGVSELYALGAFAGTHTVNGRYALQVGMSRISYI